MAGGDHIDLGNTAKIQSLETADVKVQEEKLDENHVKQKNAISIKLTKRDENYKSNCKNSTKIIAKRFRRWLRWCRESCTCVIVLTS